LDYKQPPFYHFSKDSITLAKHAASVSIDRLDKIRVLDLCAGCGVIGLEFDKLINISCIVDFLELQPEFIPYLKSNIYSFGTKKSKIINRSFVDLNLDINFEKRYDIVLCNPPYFDTKSGRPSKNSLKYTCRFFSTGSFDELLRSVKYILKDDGKVFVLVRTDMKDRIESIKKIFSRFELKRVKDDLVLLII
jgi:tRNA1(Val) A37 N6-methylase TrmN6